MSRLTVKQLAAISQNPDPVTYDLKGDVEALVPEMVKAGITTKRRVAAFLANIIQETDRLKTLEEYGDERYFRSFLGDQWRYHGRGYIMNTWRDAYERLSSVLGVDLVRDPDKLANNKNLAARAAIWFWEKGNVTGESINRYADQGNVKAVCSITNRGQVEPQGPINGWDMRVHFHQRALNILPDGFTLDAGEEPEEPESPEPPEEKLLGHGVVDGTNFAKGHKYVMPLVGHMKYWVWVSGGVPEGEGAYAVNKPLPPVSELKGKRIFCAGVPTLYRRAASKIIPTRGHPLYDGGIAAYFFTSAFGGLGPGFFSGVDVPFHMATAKKWAKQTGSGVLLGRTYRNATLQGQGHVAILLPDDKVLQSFPFGPNGEPGLNTDYTIEQSHDGGYYEVMVHPSNWINHDKHNF
jgi:predicted chitinase